MIKLSEITDYKQLINTVVQGDCLEGMKMIPDNSVDLVVTSPPYNLVSGHHTGNKKTQAYDDNLPENEYQNWQIKILNECKRVLKSNGSILYNHKNRIKNGVQFSPYEWLFKTELFIKQELVWFNGSQNFDKCRFYPMTERIYWLSKTPDTTFNNKINHHDLFKWQAEGTNKKHTRSFPVKMITDFIYCFEADIILDPFMGSWTTARACKDLGRNFIGFELSEEYCSIGESRLEQQVLDFS